MKKQEYAQQLAHYQNRINKNQRKLNQAREEYIKANCEYPIGTELLIGDYGKEHEVRIQSYDIDENYVLKPVYETLEGKVHFTDKPTIIRTL